MCPNCAQALPFCPFWFVYPNVESVTYRFGVPRRSSNPSSSANCFYNRSTYERLSTYDQIDPFVGIGRSDRSTAFCAAPVGLTYAGMGGMLRFFGEHDLPFRRKPEEVIKQKEETLLTRRRRRAGFWSR
jgi:hypothetical protein